MAYKQSLFKMAGFSGFGNSPMKQVSGKDYPYHAKFNPKGTSKISEATDVALTGLEGSSAKPWEKTKSVISKGKGIVSKIGKHVPKILKTGGRVLSKAFLPAAIAETMYSFGKTSVERKKAGQSGFNISKSKTNKGFNFNK